VFSAGRKRAGIVSAAKVEKCFRKGSGLPGSSNCTPSWIISGSWGGCTDGHKPLCLNTTEIYPLTVTGNSPFYKNYLYIWQHQVLVAASGHFTVMQGLSSCGAGSVAVTLRLSCSTACWDLCCLTGDRTCIPCMARQILSHWTTKEAPTLLLKALGRRPSLPLPALCGPWHALACGCITSAFASVYTWLLPLSLLVLFPFLTLPGTPVIGLQAHHQPQ